MPTTNTYFATKKLMTVNCLLPHRVFLLSEAQLTKKIRSTKLIDQKVSTKPKRKVESNIPVVRCTCGAKILVIPDLEATNRSLNRHMAKHKAADEQFLIEQIFEAAVKQEVS